MSSAPRVVGTVLLRDVYGLYTKRQEATQEPPIGSRTLFSCRLSRHATTDKRRRRAKRYETKIEATQGRCADASDRNGDTIIFVLSIQLYNMASFLRPSKTDTKHACAIHGLSHARAAQRDLSRLIVCSYSRCTSFDTIFASKDSIDQSEWRILRSKRSIGRRECFESFHWPIRRKGTKISSFWLVNQTLRNFRCNASLNENWNASWERERETKNKYYLHDIELI